MILIRKSNRAGYIKCTILWISCVFMVNSVSAQEILSTDEAVRMALENNFGIKLAENSEELARNNTSKFNSGKLPSISLDGGGNYNLDNTNVNFQNGSSTKLTGAGSYGLNASVNVAYTLYDGNIRNHTISQLRQRLQLSQLETHAVMENIVAQTLSQYYSIASLGSNISILEEALKVSQERLTRSKEKFEFGQATGLEILNAEVDLKNDSINWVNTILQFQNAKRQLNNLLVTEYEQDYLIDTSVTFLNGLDKDDLQKSMLDNHILIQQSDRNITIGNISLDLAKARKLPTVGTSMSYGYNYNNNNPASFASSVNRNGLGLGLNIRWNLFDGGSRRVAEEAATINVQSFVLQKEKLINDLIFDFERAWANYQNSIYVYQTEIRNAEINRQNFDRSKARLDAGQITSLDFRQAQLNLLNAQTNTIVAKYQVKINEVQLLLLSGRILPN